MLISDSRVPPDRQVLYALQGIAALRHGEAAGLRWKHYEPNTPMLRRLVIATSYEKGHTKTKRTRYMPVHPTLAALLAGWKLRGVARDDGPLTDARRPRGAHAPANQPALTLYMASIPPIRRVELDRALSAVTATITAGHFHSHVPFPTSIGQSASGINSQLKAAIDPLINVPQSVQAIPAASLGMILSMKVMPNGDFNTYVQLWAGRGCGRRSPPSGRCV
jgi:hypothetical protein